MLLISLGASKPKTQDRVSKIGYGHISLRGENRSVLISTFLLLMEEIKNSYLSTAMMNIINDDAEQMQ